MFSPRTSRLQATQWKTCSKPSREEEDLIARSTKKIKLGVDGSEAYATSDSEAVSPKQDPPLSPRRKPSYKDIAIAADRMEEDPEDIVRALVRFADPEDYKEALYEGSEIGTMLKIDELTSIHSRGRFARIYVEIDLRCQPVPYVSALGQTFKVEYEGLHLICFNCGKYEHKLEDCVEKGNSPYQTVPPTTNIVVSAQPIIPRNSEDPTPASQNEDAFPTSAQEPANDAIFGPWMLPPEDEVFDKSSHSKSIVYPKQKEQQSRPVASFKQRSNKKVAPKAPSTSSSKKGSVPPKPSPAPISKPQEESPCTTDPIKSAEQEKLRVQKESDMLDLMRRYKERLHQRYNAGAPDGSPSKHDHKSEEMDNQSQEVHMEESTPIVDAPMSKLFSVIYASTSEPQRMDLWDELRSFSQTYQNIPWCVVGDFNTVLYDTEKHGGAPVKRSSLLYFDQCLNDCLLADIGPLGFMAQNFPSKSI
ncbi:Endonuclease/exonuclease/phosphatase superfamily [Sesbania bispinosa]|nr:Endonuclease/exonuclease/phosphatase superfamily [Sesbania bispinosa]